MIKTYGWKPNSTWSTDPLFMKYSSGEYFWYHNDHLGTPQKLTSVNGAVVWSATYNSFGESTIEIEMVTNGFRFPGQYFDAESGLHYNGYRYYDAKTGRYISKDPIGLKGGFNLFAYVDGNPTNLIDSLGLFGDGLTKYQDPKTKTKGHSDFYGGDRFDFTKEDNDIRTAPIPLVGDPGRHFLPPEDSLKAVNNAIINCDLDGFERAMHRYQDSFSHYNKGYRWDSGNTNLPCNGWGHACLKGRNADKDMKAWEGANDSTKLFVDKYKSKCGCPPKLPKVATMESKGGDH